MSDTQYIVLFEECFGEGVVGQDVRAFDNMEDALTHARVRQQINHLAGYINIIKDGIFIGSHDIDQPWIPSN